MKKFLSKQRNFVIIGLIVMMVVAFGSRSFILAHGGEDHGDEKPKTTATDKGTIAHTSRLGAYEIMLKHPPFEPDQATAARFFVTKFETNEAGENVSPQIEFESASGAVTPATIEKTDTAGTFLVKIPALPEGVYTVRAKVTYAGETDTATFSGVEVKTLDAAAAESGAMSWARSALIAVVFTIVLIMFAALVYFVWRFAGSGGAADGGSGARETVSA